MPGRIRQAIPTHVHVTIFFATHRKVHVAAIDIINFATLRKKDRPMPGRTHALIDARAHVRKLIIRARVTNSIG